MILRRSPALRRARALPALFSVAVSLGATLLAPPAHAQQGASQKAAAEVLFEEGRRLVAEGKFAEACPKFADSEALDASSATLLNLANCFEKQGRTASAWATYKEAASLANAIGRADHQATAEKRAAALAPKLSRVTVVPAAPIDGMEIRRDGAPVGRAEWGLAIPVDPGSHTIEATAPRHKPWTTKIDVAAGAPPVTVSVPALEELPAATAATTPGEGGSGAASSTAPASGGGAGANGATGAATTSPAAPSAGEEAPRRGQTQRIAAIAAAGAGVVALGVGAGFALSAKSKYDDSLASCPRDKNLCTPAGVSLRDDARAAGNVATVAFAIGGAAIAAGAVLWFTAPRATTEARLEIAPTPGGAMVRGRW